MFNIAVTDNNPFFLHNLEEKIRKIMCDKYLPFYIRTYESSAELIADLNDRKTYDLLFSDIRLNGQENGIDTAGKIKELCPDIQIVFVTYYPQHFLDVYEVPHIYFIPKDRVDELLPKAIDTALTNHQYSENDMLAVKTKYDTAVIRKQDILFLEKDLRQITVHTKEEDLTFYSSFKDIQEKLGDRFVRCHKSYVINIDQITRIEGNTAVMSDGTRIPVSRTYSRSGFLKAVK